MLFPPPSTHHHKSWLPSPGTAMPCGSPWPSFPRPPPRHSLSPIRNSTNPNWASWPCQSLGCEHSVIWSLPGRPLIAGSGKEKFPLDVCFYCTIHTLSLLLTLSTVTDSRCVSPLMLSPLMAKMRSPFFSRPSLSAGDAVSTLCTVISLAS